MIVKTTGRREKGLYPRENYRVYLNDLDGLEEDLYRQIFKIGKVLYIQSYEDKGKDYLFHIENFDGRTGGERFEDYLVPKNKVSTIENITMI